jgi:hypothetical protein
MASGEIALANFPFGGGAGMKLRPVLLLTGLVGPVPEVVVDIREGFFRPEGAGFDSPGQRPGTATNRN